MVRIGTLFHVPTIITRPQRVIVGNLQLMEEVRARDPLVGHSIVGYHIEGPYIIGGGGPPGVHDPAYTESVLS